MQSPGGPEANCNRAGDGRNQVRIGSAVLWPPKFLRILSPETPVPLPQNIEKRTAVGRTGHSSRALGFPRSRHWNDLSRHGSARVQISLATQSGNLRSRSIAWKRGSLRSGSMNASVFTYSTPGSGSRTALASHPSALAVLPHPAQTVTHRSGFRNGKLCCQSEQAIEATDERHNSLVPLSLRGPGTRANGYQSPVQ